ncbi:YT521-B-like domain-containing protein [Rhexocercosporidium sp. MPI-PUGE-AT-0058]|nr:YT521-B-like domain-containing protein [Rhexocercosporidium sp. MPI-PUGE-AT-0058]
MSGSSPSHDYSNVPQGSRSNSSQNPGPGQYIENEAGKGFQGPSQLPNTSQQFSQGQPDPFALTSLSNSLPDVAYQNYSNANVPSPRYSTGPSPSPLLYQFQNVPQFAGQQPMGQPFQNMQYNMGYPPQYQGMYGLGQTQQAHNSQPTLNSGSQFYQGQGFMGQQQSMSPPFMVHTGQYGIQAQAYPVSSTSGSFGARGSFMGEPRQPGQQLSQLFGGGNPGRSSSIASSSAQSSVVRGPPRKPRQSGHAIWVGNLPPQTDLMSLVLHVCKETVGLESLFLISKSNCAFANFKDEAACAAAQMKIHDSRFQTVRLVSRLRRNSVGTAAGASVPTGPAALSPPPNPLVARSTTPDSDTKSKEGEGEVGESKAADDGSPSKDKFFIVKSLTVEDLELSVRNGIWATQSHNEDALNKAYQTADTVYLVFSANKSGEYFGYAKMISPINNDPAAAIEFAPTVHTTEDPELPKAIPTPASEFAPKGRIIDDSARGTIFWEVERDETNGVDEDDESQSNRSDEDPDSKSSSKAWGKPFHVEWVSTTRLPFYRTRGLRNPWNSNREVKIARDGTELEGSVGRRLLALFHRLPSPVAPSMPVIGAYPPMRQF